MIQLDNSIDRIKHRLPWFTPSSKPCPYCGVICESTHYSNPDTDIENGIVWCIRPVWRCPECGRRYKRENGGFRV